MNSWKSLVLQMNLLMDTLTNLIFPVFAMPPPVYSEMIVVDANINQNQIYGGQM